jgi:DNA-binding CsgD family transcriptional regulator
VPLQRGKRADVPKAKVHPLEHAGRRYLVFDVPLVRPRLLARLTPAELDVVDRWMEGASVAEIAAGRRSSANTVQNQLTSIYRKLGTNSRAEILQLIRSAGRLTTRGC